jgi:hypothetical protein
VTLYILFQQELLGFCIWLSFTATSTLERNPEKLNRASLSKRNLFVSSIRTSDLTNGALCLLFPLTDGSDSRDKPKLYRLQLSVTEVGTEKFDDNSIQVLDHACCLSVLRLFLLSVISKHSSRNQLQGNG